MALYTGMRLPLTAMQKGGSLLQTFSRIVVTCVILLAILVPSIGWAQTLAAAVLPSSRSVQVGVPATAFATIINPGTTTATGCSLAPLTSMPATFVYQTTNPTTNVVTGTANTPIDVSAGRAQTFVFAFTPTAPFAPTDIQLRFDCGNTEQATIVTGVNTLLLTASNDRTPDMVALAATLSNDGIVHIDPSTGSGVFAVAAVNVGSSGAITVRADTGSASPPVSISLCETNPATGACLAAPSSNVTTQINANATPSFGIFVTGNGTVPFDPATNRLFVRFVSADSVTRGSTSVAVQTGGAPPPPVGNRAPVAHAVSLQADPALSYVEHNLVGTDPDGDTITYELLAAPSGTGYTSAYVNPQRGTLYATVAPGFSGLVSLSYRVTDGQLYSTPAAITIEVAPISVTDNGLGDNTIAPTTYAGFTTGFFEGALLGAPGRTPTRPLRVDLSPRFPVPGDQGPQGSCVGWATAYALKSYQEGVEIGWDLNTQAHLFSPAFIYNQINHGQDNGSFINEALDLIIRDGAATLATMPYNEANFLEQPSTVARQEAATYRARRWSKANGTEGMKDALANRLPVVIGIDVYESFMRLSGPDSVYNTSSGPLQGGHAITVVGYDDSRFGGAFRIINSWGTGWGDGGYFWLPYSFVPTVMHSAFVLEDAENSTNPGPQDPTGPPPQGPLPNLQVQSWNANYDPRPRGQGQLMYRVINAGTGVAPVGVAVNLMLSTSTTIATSDLYVIREQIPFTLEPGSAAVRDATNPIPFSFPDTLEPGTYSMAVWIDDLNEVQESNESDNISVGNNRSLLRIAFLTWLSRVGMRSGTLPVVIAPCNTMLSTGVPLQPITPIGISIWC